jgi:carboxypeptidase PM20D1
MNEVVLAMCKALAPYATEEPFKTLMADPEGNQKEIMDFFLSDDKLAPMLHTTIACNMISGSPAPNVLPQRVESVVNLRLAPQETVDKVLEHMKKATEGLDVDVHVLKGRNPSGISKAESYGMDIIKSAVAEFFPEAGFVPGLIMGGTDACHYENLCDCCYRFRPMIDGMVLGHTVHGTDERQGIPALGQGVRTLIHIMKTACID